MRSPLLLSGLLFAALCSAQPFDPCDSLYADFSFTHSPNGTQFHAITSGEGSPTTWYWVFGDNTVSHQEQPFHTFPGPGTYEVCFKAMTVHQIEGVPVECEFNVCHVVVITAPDPCEGLEACFEVQELDNNAYFFSNCSSTGGLNTQYFWSFGDGASSTSNHADHLYQAPGTYTVCLIAMAGNCVDSTCTSVVVTEGGGEPCEGFEACFEVQELDNNAYFFSNCSSTGGLNTQYFWSFGDGTSSTSNQADHLYQAPGTYTVCLIALAGNCVDSTCTSVVVTEGGGEPCEGFEACFVSNDLGNGNFFFDNCSSTLGNEASFLWLFGDGTTGTTTNAEHHFPAPGTYNVCLIAMAGDCVDSTCTSVTITGEGGGCEGFSNDFEVVFGDVVVVFTAFSTPEAVGHLWNFGDGSEGSGEVVEHYFPQAGPYEVCLHSWYWNEEEMDSCWATTCRMVDLFSTGVADASGASGFQLYPQPAEDHVTISGPASLGTATVRLFGMDGRLERQERVSSWPHVLDLSGLGAAVHLLRIDGEGTSFQRRVIVQ
ncbi:MAG TPA: PKD domain-containing protein [Flavobacteriales bacterium]